MDIARIYRDGSVSPANSENIKQITILYLHPVLTKWMMNAENIVKCKEISRLGDIDPMLVMRRPLLRRATKMMRGIIQPPVRNLDASTARKSVRESIFWFIVTNE
jgi:hypothetical protein